MNIKLGIGPDSWGVWFPDDPKQPPWQQFLDEVPQAGFEWIELGPYGYLPTDSSTLRRELNSRGLKASGSFVIGQLFLPSEWPKLERQVLGWGELLASLGAEYLVVIDNVYNDPFTGEQVSPKRLDEDQWRQLIDTTNRIADLAQDEFGLHLLFHPHAGTHVEHEDQIERLMDQTDPQRVSICFDTGMHAYYDYDGVAFMRRHHQRIPYLHIKDVDPKIRSQAQAENLPFAEASAMGMFCEPSEGVVDFPALVEALREVDFDGFAIVEQDMYPTEFDKPLPIAKRTYQYLRRIGF